ncbi:MAG TPA: invasion associated locus B family protein [Pseudolabrys sp.]
MTILRGLGAKIGVLGVVGFSVVGFTIFGLGIVLPSSGEKASAAQPKTKAPAPTKSERVETINYNAWVVTCRDTVGEASSTKTCVADLRVVGPTGHEVLLNWEIGFDKNHDLVTVFQVPLGIAVKKDNHVSGGILLKNGLELKFDDAAPLRVGFTTCNAQFCEAVRLINEALFKQAAAATTASITTYATDGTPIPLSSLKIQGIDKAMAAVRR